jgi:Sec-independent protein translocase protein TatA
MIIGLGELLLILLLVLLIIPEDIPKIINYLGKFIFAVSKIGRESSDVEPEDIKMKEIKKKKNIPVNTKSTSGKTQVGKRKNKV